MKRLFPALRRRYNDSIDLLYGVAARKESLKRLFPALRRRYNDSIDLLYGIAAK